MTTLPFQGTIVGRDAIPKRKAFDTKWSFLEDVELLEGQALRLICPTGDISIVAKQKWHRIYPGRGHTRTVANTDVTVTLYLWLT